MFQLLSRYRFIKGFFLSSLILAISVNASAECIKTYEAAINRNNAKEAQLVGSIDARDEYIHARIEGRKFWRHFLQDKVYWDLWIGGFVFATVMLPIAPHRNKKDREWRDANDKIDGQWRDLAYSLVSDEQDVLDVFQESKRKFGPTLLNLFQEVSAANPKYTSIEQIAEIVDGANRYNFFCQDTNSQFIGLSVDGYKMYASPIYDSTKHNSGLVKLTTYDEIKTLLIAEAIPQFHPGESFPVDSYYEQLHKKEDQVLTYPKTPDRLKPVQTTEY